MFLRVLTIAVFLSLTACAATPVEEESPEVGNLRLIATDLVSATLQIRELNPVTTTLQFSIPVNEFGRVLETAFRNAGYGLQRVTADQGRHYVSYAIRSSETDAGTVTDYLIRISGIEIRREYNRTSAGVYPSSLMFIQGTDSDTDIQLSDDIFAEQGGEESYLSGVEPANDQTLTLGTVREIVSDSDTGIVAERRTGQQAALNRARDHFYESDRKFENSNLENMVRYKRVVILFGDNKTMDMGVGNKQALAILFQDYQRGDVFEITACDDFDGKNEMAERRAVRVKEEFLGLGAPTEAVFRAPCVRANFRHQSDNSPVPVAIVHYRKGNPATDVPLGF